MKPTDTQRIPRIGLREGVRKHERGQPAFKLHAQQQQYEITTHYTAQHSPPRPCVACTYVIYTVSISGRSSRSTLMLMKCRFMIAAISGLSNDSRSCQTTQVKLESESGSPATHCFGGYHHVTPVAGAVSDAQKNGLVLRFGGFKRLRTPLIPESIKS
jgi:hypothetical protein